MWVVRVRGNAGVGCLWAAPWRSHVAFGSTDRGRAEFDGAARRAGGPARRGGGRRRPRLARRGGAVVFSVRVEGPLWYANAERFHEQVEELELFYSRRGEAPLAIVLCASSISFIDATALSVLEEMTASWKRRAVHFYVASAYGQPKALLEAALGDAVGDCSRTIDACLAAENASRTVTTRRRRATSHDLPRALGDDDAFKVGFPGRCRRSRRCLLPRPAARREKGAWIAMTPRAVAGQFRIRLGVMKLGVIMRTLCSSHPRLRCLAGCSGREPRADGPRREAGEEGIRPDTPSLCSFPSVYQCREKTI